MIAVQMACIIMTLGNLQKKVGQMHNDKVYGFSYIHEDDLSFVEEKLLFSHRFLKPDFIEALASRFR